MTKPATESSDDESDKSHDVPIFARSKAKRKIADVDDDEEVKEGDIVENAEVGQDDNDLDETTEPSEHDNTVNADDGEELHLEGKQAKKKAKKALDRQAAIARRKKVQAAKAASWVDMMGRTAKLVSKSKSQNIIKQQGKPKQKKSKQ